MKDEIRAPLKTPAWEVMGFPFSLAMGLRSPALELRY